MASAGTLAYAPARAEPARAGRAFPAPAPSGADPEARLRALARAGAPLRRGIARLAGRMERLRGWEPLGFARRRDYAAERLGISGRQLQELAHVDRALAALPAVERAFVAGGLTWTKARLLARVATPEDQKEWIERAAALTARELSREVRAVDARAHDLLSERDEDGDGEAKETVFVRCTPLVRAKWHRARFLASRMEGHPVPAWRVAEQLAAEALSAIPLDAAALRQLEAERAGDGPEGEEAAAPNGCATQGSGAEPLAPAPHPSTAVGASSGAWTANGCATHGLAAREDPFVAALVAGLDEADAFELDARLRRALAAEQRLEATLGPWLLAVARGRLYRRHGCGSLGAFAREGLGMSASKAEALVRLERACEGSPTLREAYRAGRLSWAQAQLLIPILRLKMKLKMKLRMKPEGAAPWHPGWVALAERISVRRLHDEVARALALGELEPPPLDPPTGNWDDGPQTGAHPTPFPKSMSFFFTAPREVARLFRGALATVQRRIEQGSARTASESEALDALLEHAFETWQLANAELARAHRVFERDGWRCTFPGCTSYGNLQDHHLEYRSHGGSNQLSNRTTLCVWHHLRGEHAKVVRCRGKAPAKLRFELGLRPGRPPLARYRSGDVRVS